MLNFHDKIEKAPPGLSDFGQSYLSGECRRTGSLSPGLGTPHTESALGNLNFRKGKGGMKKEEKEGQMKGGNILGFLLLKCNYS